MNLKKHTDLQKKIDTYKIKRVESKPLSGGNIAFNIAIELVSATIVGVLVGLLLDNLFDSRPFFLIICMILAMVAVFKLIWHKYIKKNGA